MEREERSVRSAGSPPVDTVLPRSKKPRPGPGKAAGGRRPPSKPATEADDERALRRQLAAVQIKLAKLPRELPESSQDLAGRLALTLTAIEEERAFHLLHVVGVAASAISVDPPNVRLVKRVLDGVERQLLLRRKIRYVMQGLGMGLLITLVLTVLAWLYTPAVTGFDRIELGLVALAGFVGASVSLAIKIGNYARLKGVDTRVLRWTALFKPLIGMAFALFVYMALNSGVVSINLAGTSRNYFFVAVAFVAGFSERFAKDVISRVERSAVGGAGEQASSSYGNGEITLPPELEAQLQTGQVSRNDRKGVRRR
jgi:hypothetical protein